MADQTLTKKQAEVMGFVYQGLSSKEIALRIGISPATVDQRADGARKKLGAATRMEAARIYAADQGISERFIYEPFPLTHSQSERRHQASPHSEVRFEDSLTFDERAAWDRLPSWRLPALEPRDLGTVGRIAVILALTVFILLIVVEGLRLAHSLGLMFRV